MGINPMMGGLPRNVGVPPASLQNLFGGMAGGMGAGLPSMPNMGGGPTAAPALMGPPTMAPSAPQQRPIPTQPMMGGNAQPMMGGNAITSPGAIGGMQFADGGGVGQMPFQGGFIHSDIPGRTDKIPMTVPPGSHVLPADTLSGLGEGNTLAGVPRMNQALQAMASRGARNSNGNALKRGGNTGDGKPTDIIVAGGEYIIPPQMVIAIGGGDQKKGHDIIDQMILNIRKATAAKLRSLPGPKK